MNRLLQIGFQPAGHWSINQDKLTFELTRHSTANNILYAFVCNGLVKYVGKSVQPLAKRMAGYRTPGGSQPTNVRCHGLIRAQLREGVAVQILALPDNGLMHYGQFHLNLAAGLEDDIIRVLSPDWNGGKGEAATKVRSASTQDVAPEEQRDLEPEPDDRQPATHSFSFVLQRTYFRSGFFNIGVSAQQFIGNDGETIELYLGNSALPILGAINRRANSNGTPRIMGGTQLRDWFQTTADEMAKIGVEVMSPTSIRLRLLQRQG